MCYKILKTDGKVACQTTVRYLTFGEHANPEHKKLRNDFDNHFTDWMGASATMKDFHTSDLTPECVYYEDPYSTIHEGYPDKILPTP